MTEIEKFRSIMFVSQTEAIKSGAAIELVCKACGKPLLLYIRLEDYYVLGHLDDLKCGFVYHGKSLDDVMKLWIQDQTGVELD